MPAEAAFRKDFSRGAGFRSRPSGSPRKIVNPAIPPSRMVWAVLTGLLRCGDRHALRSRLIRQTAEILSEHLDLPSRGFGGSSSEATPSVDPDQRRVSARVYNRVVADDPATNGDVEHRRKIFLLDGHSLSYRAFFALPTSLATTSGQITNAVYGFTSMLIKLLAEERPDYIVVAFDLGRPTVRLAQYADYKAGRQEAPDEFRQQLGLILEVLQTLKIPMVSVEGYEADDAIATLACRAADRGLEAVIVTADRDFFQLVRPGIEVMFNRRGISDIVTYDVAAVAGRFGLPPEKYLDYVALKGDTSDNIPGVPGVGEKTASKLVQDFGSVEDLLDRTQEVKGRLRTAIEAAGQDLIRNKELARLNCDLELDLDPEACVMGEWDHDAVRRLFNSLEFRTLLERLEDVERSAKPKVEAASLDVRAGVSGFHWAGGKPCTCRSTGCPMWRRDGWRTRTRPSGSTTRRTCRPRS